MDLILISLVQGLYGKYKQACPFKADLPSIETPSRTHSLLGDALPPRELCAKLCRKSPPPQKKERLCKQLLNCICRVPFFRL